MVPITRVCKKCEKLKRIEEFGFTYYRGRKGFLYTCKECRASKAREREKDPVVRDSRHLHHREYRLRLKRLVIDHYGGKCSCCGEEDDRFLTIDHINDDGKEHRRTECGGKGGSTLYKWARDNGFPDSLRVLCFNCNSGRALNGGICPHKDHYLERRGSYAVSTTPKSKA